MEAAGQGVMPSISPRQSQCVRPRLCTPTIAGLASTVVGFRVAAIPNPCRGDLNVRPWQFAIVARRPQNTDRFARRASCPPVTAETIGHEGQTFHNQVGGRAMLRITSGTVEASDKPFMGQRSAFPQVSPLTSLEAHHL